MVKEMMGMSPLFAQFIAQKGLNFVLDNMEGKGVEQLKQMVDQWLQEMQQQQQQQTQMQQQMMSQDPQMMKNQIEMQKLQMEKEKMQLQHQIDLLKLEVEHNKIDANILMQNKSDKMDMARAALVHHEKMTDKVIKQGGVQDTSKHLIKEIREEK
jgi:hypothetical protein